MTAQHAFPAKKIADWNKPLKINYRSLIRAAEDLIGESIDLITEYAATEEPVVPDVEALGKALAKALDKTEVLIDETLFFKPKSLPIIEAF